MRIKLLIFSLLFSVIGWSQTVISAWTFPTTTGNAPATLAAECGVFSASANLYADGTNGSSNWSVATTRQYFGGVIPSASLCGVTTATGAYSLVAPATPFNNGFSIVFKMPTTGYQDLILTYDTRGTAAGYTTHDWAYSTDGSSFTNFSTIGGRNTTTFSTQTVDFSSVSALDNIAFVYVRLTVTGATVSGGNNRFDNVKFSATLLPTSPEINIQGNLTTITDGDNIPSITDDTDFGTTTTSTNVVKTYTIQNTGTANLSVTNVAMNTGSVFTVGGITLPATIPASGSTTFTVTFNSASTGTFNDTVVVTSNDADETTYNYDVTATIPAGSSPEINIQGNSTTIADGDVTPAIADDTDFGTTTTSTNVVKTYTIQNTGTANLSVTNVAMNTGSVFTVGGITLPETVLPGASTTFTVTFNSAATGTFTDTVLVTSDDADEATYNYNVTATIPAATPEINIQGNSTIITDGDVTPSLTDDTSFGSAMVSTNIVKTFAIQNTGTTDLNVSAIAMTTGTRYVVGGITLPA
ncbi:MAG TPA: choice-of-anchor D domain-containing protein, partial [Flavobacterium sp.]|nr:choice-of-anchor D domain-containing protein [Flavobacterium sp.]